MNRSWCLRHQRPGSIGIPSSLRVVSGSGQWRFGPGVGNDRFCCSFWAFESLPPVPPGGSFSATICACLTCPISCLSRIIMLLRGGRQVRCSISQLIEQSLISFNDSESTHIHFPTQHVASPPRRCGGAVYMPTMVHPSPNQLFKAALIPCVLYPGVVRKPAGSEAARGSG